MWSMETHNLQCIAHSLILDHLARRYDISSMIWASLIPKLISSSTPMRKSLGTRLIDIFFTLHTWLALGFSFITSTTYAEVTPTLNVLIQMWLKETVKTCVLLHRFVWWKYVSVWNQPIGPIYGVTFHWLLESHAGMFFFFHLLASQWPKLLWLAILLLHICSLLLHVGLSVMDEQHPIRHHEPCIHSYPSAHEHVFDLWFSLNPVFAGLQKPWILISGLFNAFF